MNCTIELGAKVHLFPKIMNFMGSYYRESIVSHNLLKREFSWLMTFRDLHFVLPSIHMLCGHEYKALPSYHCSFFHIPSEEYERLPIFLSVFLFSFLIPAKLHILKHHHRTSKSFVAWTHTCHLKTSSLRLDRYWLNHISSKLRKTEKNHTTKSKWPSQICL